MYNSQSNIEFNVSYQFFFLIKLNVLSFNDVYRLILLDCTRLDSANECYSVILNSNIMIYIV